MERKGRATWPVGWDHDLGGVFSGGAQWALPTYKSALSAVYPPRRAAEGGQEKYEQFFQQFNDVMHK